MVFDDYSGDIWHDSSLDQILIEYNDIIMDLETDVGIKKFVFKNYIAFDYIGQWDENIVKAIYVENDNDFIKCALEKVNSCNVINSKGGGTRDINSDWKCIVIQLIDNVCIRIVCSDVVYM